MTALCGGGTSGPQPGAAAVVAVTSGFIALALDEAGIGWMKPLIPLMTLPEIALSGFCGSDPAAIPTFSQAEANALLNITLDSNFFSGLGKLPALLQNLYWNAFCQCTSGVYTPPSWPAQPAGSVTTVPPSVLAAPCTSESDNFVNLPVNNGTTSMVLQTIGLNASNVYYNGTFTTADPAIMILFQLEWQDSGGTWHNFGSTFSPGGAGTFTFQCAGVLPTANAPVRCQHASTGTVGQTMTLTATLSIYCNGQTAGGIQQPCCPPDSATAATLQTILALVTSMQRNYAPFAYLLGSSSAGLTGTGSVPVSRGIGVKVAVTAYPASDQVLPGNPSYIKDLGWISVSEADGMIQELRITRTAFTWFPELMPIATLINYFLQPGVTATITPLLPEV